MDIRYQWSVCHIINMDVSQPCAYKTSCKVSYRHTYFVYFTGWVPHNNATRWAHYCICFLCLCVCGCAQLTGNQDPWSQDAGANKTPTGENHASTESKQAIPHYARLDRYSVVDTKPTTEQVEPLLGHITVSFGEHIRTIGDALFELLRGSGYRILYEDKQSCMLSKQLLFAREFPLALRSLGPITLKDALETIAGKAWSLRVSELKRTLSFYARQEYMEADNPVEAYVRTSAPTLSDRYAHEKFSIEFNTGEFHAPTEEGREILRQAAQSIQTLPATALARGHAHSSGHWATEGQALRRAKTVRDLLVAHGVDIGRIRLDVSVSNDNDPLLHKFNGTELLLFTRSAQNEPTNIANGLNCNLAQHASATRGSNSQATPIFTVQVGSLRKNIERLLSALGLRMGKWDLADGHYEYDWEIPHSYTIEMGTPDQALHAMLASYGIQPILNILDNSVDFVMRHKPVAGRP